jgi:hypothetical protein
MISKRAAAHELAQQKLAAHTATIRTLINRYNIAPEKVDYNAEMSELRRNNPKDLKLLKIAESEAYIQAREK